MKRGRLNSSIGILAPGVVPIHRGAMKKAAFIIGIAFVLFGVLIPLLVTAATFILPPTYSSRALISVEAGSHGPPPNRLAEIERMQSRSILGMVASNLNLSKEWARKYKQPEALSADKTYQLLRSSIQLRPQRDTTLIEIHAYSDDKEEAARVANMIAEVYSASVSRDAMFPFKYSAQIIESAGPIDKPFRPNKPLNIAVGCAAGIVLIAAGAFLLRIGLRQKAREI
jgi:capsular polysaccharide biosynthesis protein